MEGLEAVGLWQPTTAERVPLGEALGRVTAEPVIAALSAPHYHASAMDGFAVRARDTAEATETNPVTMTVIEEHTAVEQAERPMMPVNTGHPMPRWANAVIMIEHVQPGEAPDERIIRAAVSPWKHVRPMGEDMVTTELVLPANHTIRPVDLGAIAGCGHAQVTVRRQPRVAVIPTGSELVSAEDAAQGGVEAGHIIEYNSLVMAGQLTEWGGQPTRWAIVPDEYEAIKQAVRQAAEAHDLVLVNAGSSAGSEDYTAHVVRELGEVLVHGVAVRPGHPVIFGLIHLEGRSVPVVGVPGYPVSAALTGEIFIEPILSKWLGRPPYEPPTLQATLSRKLTSPTGDDDYIRVTVGKVGERTVATPLARGAGVITSLVRADGIVRVPRFSEGAHAGDEVTVHLYRTPKEIDRTLVAIGSHDMTLDLLAQHLAERGHRLASANAGSLGGLVALKRREAHFGGCHLLDPATGGYNWRYIRQYLPGVPVTLITLVEREQGLIVPRGNPQGISGMGDVAREDVSVVNRQRGAGTRILFDYELEQAGLTPADVKGYTREEYTHLAVAAQVASGTASCGLGVRAAARALDLDFVPVTKERYDLVIPTAHQKALTPLLAVLHDEGFRTDVAALPGYDITLMGHEQEAPDE
jgi:putative molybdopterin biosynthesis protein